ncbi:MAG: 4-hydroxythreonine-4-phosphate dehydrogenase PdxA [Humibacter sp.]
MKLPRIAVTMGDPAGVGPEIIVRALSQDGADAVSIPYVIGDVAWLRRTADLIGVPARFVTVAGTETDETTDPGAIRVIDLGPVGNDIRFGEMSAAAGEAAYQYVSHAVSLAKAGAVEAICTAPLNKQALHAAGHIYPGHTELLAELTDTPEVSMMLATPTLRVIHVTTHLGLIDAIAAIEPGLVHRTIQRGNEALVAAGIERPRIAVCAINPHAGENGLFGAGEEELKIAPGIALAVEEGIDAVGPVPADTAFFRAVRGDFDLVVAMYHDQGHCPVKVLGIDAGVNITVGLPVVRTSVDHGTAFDIAGKGIADAAGMEEALRQAAQLAHVRR